MTFSAKSLVAAAAIGAGAMLALDALNLLNPSTHNYLNSGLMGAGIGLAVQVGAGVLGVS